MKDHPEKLRFKGEKRNTTYASLQLKLRIINDFLSHSQNFYKKNDFSIRCS